MNLRIAPEHLRFRISEDELEHLHEQGALTVRSRVADQLCIEYTLQLGLSEGSIGPALLKVETRQEAHLVRLVVTFDRALIAQLSEPSTRKEGLREFVVFDHGDILTVDLQVDLQRKKGIST